MSAIGPDLPPHLSAKRKRKQDEQAKDEPATSSGAKDASNPDGGEKKRKVIGPAMPPASLDERPEHPANDVEGSDSDSDDDFGPALPNSDAVKRTTSGDEQETEASNTPPAPVKKLRRDDWMTMPPKQDDLAARMDPTKQRARGFNTGKGAKGPAAHGEDSSAWNETPEQKRKRLQDEMMGVSKSASPGLQKVSKPARDEAKDAAAREEIAKSRGPSLMDQHSQGKGKDVEDDPSKRAFDREKDMVSGARIDGTQRKQLLNNASGFSSRFSGGSYL